MKSPFSRDVNLLLAASGLFSISFYGLQTIVKILYVLRLGHGPEYLGIFSSTSAFTFMAMSLPAGALGDRFGRRGIIVIGGGVTVLGLLLLPLTESLPKQLEYIWPIFSQIVLTTGWPMFTVNLVPMLLVATTEETRGKAYALNGALKGLGTFIGTVFGGMLPGLVAAITGHDLLSPYPYRIALYVGTSLGLGAMIPLFFIRSGERVQREQQPQERGGRFPFLFVLLLILHVFFGHAVWSVVRVFCPAYMDKSLNLTSLSIGLIVGAGQFVAIGAPFVIPRLSERRGSGWAVMATSVGMIVALIPVVVVRHWMGVALTTMGLLVLSAVWLPVLQIYQMEMVSNRWRSLAYGAVSMALGLSFGFFSLIGGYMAAGGGYQNVFWLAIAFSAVGVLFMGVLLGHFRKR